MRQAFIFIGPAIKLLRTRAGMLQGELADAAGVTKQQVSKYERGLQRPNLDSLQRLMMALGVNRLDLDRALTEVEDAAVASGGEEQKANEEEARRERKQRAALGIYQAIEDLVEELVEERAARKES